MAKHELALLLGKSVTEIDELPYEELVRWYAYLEQRPIGWREDNRAAVIAMSFGGSDKIKPEDLFPSLGTLRRATATAEKPVAQQFFERFKHKFSEKDVVEKHA